MITYGDDFGGKAGFWAREHVHVGLVNELLFSFQLR